MQWLLNVDVALFRFINGTLSNPVLDRVMPFVSGNVFFFPTLVVLGAVLIWKERLKGLVFVAIMGLVVGTCDGLVCRAIKLAVGRPRPFSVLPDVKKPGDDFEATRRAVQKQLEQWKASGALEGVVETTGTAPAEAMVTGGKSMPSAHAANWFAATMVALVYYRRSIRFMLPLASVVSFSRIYNGVHYPSDVIVGAVVGAGHAAAMLWLLQSAWRWAGPKWFKQAWEKRPTIVMRDPPSSDFGATGA